MKTGWFVRTGLAVLVGLGACGVRAEEVADPVGVAVTQYVGKVMDGLRSVAEKQPLVETFREDMKPFMDGTPGVFGATLIDTDFIIRAVYFKRDFLAVGFDLKKVKQLDYFWKLMREKPAPQLSEPGHGSLLQPRLVAMRYPVMEEGRFKGIVSVMIHTETFLKAAGLDACPAFKIFCLGTLAEEKGDLGPDYQEVKLDLPATEWVIRYRK